MGLRELKKERTRQRIADTAARLFAERGFDGVPVAEVAREAEVAEATIRNYFASKEELFFPRIEEFGTRLVEAIGARAPGESVLLAYRRFLLASVDLLHEAAAGDRDTIGRLRTLHRVIADSAALRAREQQAIAGYADALAALLAHETDAPPDDPDARVAANALMGVHRTLIDYTRRRVLADDNIPRLAADVRALLDRACAMLERGLAGYAVKGVDRVDK